MSAYRVAANLREVHLMSAGASRGMRTLLIAQARTAAAHLKSVYAKAARANNHDLVRELRAARAS